MSDEICAASVRDLIAWDREYREREGLRTEGARCWTRGPNGWFSYDPDWTVQIRIDEVEARTHEAFLARNPT